MNPSGDDNDVEAASPMSTTHQIGVVGGLLGLLLAGSAAGVISYQGAAAQQARLAAARAEFFGPDRE